MDRLCSLLCEWDVWPNQVTMAAMLLWTSYSVGWQSLDFLTKWYYVVPCFYSNKKYSVQIPDLVLNYYNILIILLYIILTRIVITSLYCWYSRKEWKCIKLSLWNIQYLLGIIPHDADSSKCPTLFHSCFDVSDN